MDDFSPLSWRSIQRKILGACCAISFLIFFFIYNPDAFSQVFSNNIEFIPSMIKIFIVHFVIFLLLNNYLLSKNRSKLADSSLLSVKDVNKEQRKMKSKVFHVRRKFFKKNSQFVKDTGGFRISRNLKITEVRGREHVIIAGATGTGKSAGIFIGALREIDGPSLVITDPKGELFRKTGGYLEEKGYILKRIDFTNPAKSDRYSLLESCETHDEVRSLVTSIMESGDSKDDEWGKLSSDLMLAHTLAVYDDENGDKNLMRVIENLATIDPAEYDEFFLDKSEAAQFEYAQFKKTANAESMIASIYKTIQTKIFGLRLESVQAINSNSTFSAGDLRDDKNKYALFISFPESRSDVLSSYLTPFFNQLFDKIKTHKSVDENLGNSYGRPVTFVLDEIFSLGRISSLSKDLVTMRSKNMSAIMICQSISQIKAVYPKEYNTIMENTKTKVILNSTAVGETGDFFASLMGEEEYKQMSVSSSKAKDVSYSESVQKKAVKSKDELRRMKSNEIVIISDNLKAVKDDKNLYYLSDIDFFFFKYLPFEPEVNIRIGKFVSKILSKFGFITLEEEKTLSQKYLDKLKIDEEKIDDEVSEAQKQALVEEAKRKALFEQKEKESQEALLNKVKVDLNKKEDAPVAEVDVLNETDVTAPEKTPEFSVEKKEVQKTLSKEELKKIKDAAIQKIDLDFD